MPVPELLLSVLVSGGAGSPAAAVASARDWFGPDDARVLDTGGTRAISRDGLAVGSGGGLSLGDRMALLTMLAEQMTRAPPPEPEPLHWSIVMGWVDDIVPVAVQVS